MAILIKNSPDASGTRGVSASEEDPQRFCQKRNQSTTYAFPNTQIESVGKIIVHLVILGLADLTSSVTFSQDVQGGVMHQGG